MPSTPLNPGSLYVLDWESYSMCGPHSPPPAELPAGWRQQYLSTVNHPNNEPAFRIACASDPVRSGYRSARFQLRKGDDIVPGTGATRAELTTSPEPLINGRAERWYGFSIYLSPDYAPDRSAESLTQWHQADTTDPRFQGSPPLAIMTQAEQQAGQWKGLWKISVRKPSWDNTKDQDTNNIPVGEYETGKWTDWVVHVKWSPGNDGLLEIWKNGQLVHSTQGQNKFNDGQGNYMKFGIYKWDWTKCSQAPNVPCKADPYRGPSDTDQRVIYYDELRIADQVGSYKAVAPGFGRDQVLFINRGGSGGRVMIADFGDGNPPAEVRYWENWGQSNLLNGWHDADDLQMVNDFMGVRHR